MEPGLGQPLTRREAREREARANPLDELFPTSVVPHNGSAAPRPTSGMDLLFPVQPEQPVRPVQRLPEYVATTVPATAPVTRRRASEPPRRATTRPRGRAQGMPRTKPSAGSTFLSLGALLFAGALLVVTSLPANAFMTESTALAAATPTSAADDATALQTVNVPSDVDPSTISRDNFSVVSYQELMAAAGHTGGTFTPTTGSIRWPFPYSVPISDGWGPRVAPCSGCSTYHQGVDFTPGAGTPIYAIADGVVEEHSGDSEFESFGNHVIIQHAIPGQNVESLYAHMITGSSTLQPGDHIKVGDFIGLVGETGSAVGAHLHFEIHIDKVPVDPYAWLQANATNVP